MTENDLFQKLAKYIKEQNDIQTEAIKKEIKSETQKIKEEVQTLRYTVEEDSQKLKFLEGKQDLQEQTNETVLRALKKNNVIIWGVVYEKTASISEIAINTLNSLLGLQIKITDCSNIYPVGKSGECNRPLVVQFVSFFTKLEVLKNCKKLKSTPISISEDLTKEQREVRKVLVKFKKQATEQGKKANIKGDFLFVEGEKFTVEQLQEGDTEEEQNIYKSNSEPATPTPRRIQEYTEDIEEVFESAIQVVQAVKRNPRKASPVKTRGKSTKDKEKSEKPKPVQACSSKTIINTKSATTPQGVGKQRN